ncbi:hypothetical protein BGW42_004410 [Actinomortierella wolfii]|nr:hypothetical protein BGW42_004410 [Actinomortierella wolfii]
MAKELTVIIVGAGVGGLVMGILLDRIGIRYHILEKAPSFTCLGSSIAISPQVLRLFQQLNMLDELLAIGKPVTGLSYYGQDMSLIGRNDMSNMSERYGFQTMIFSRPELMDVLLSKIRKSRISTNKRVLEVTQNNECVVVKCSDQTSYQGDILIGCDGAYSAVRQCLYKAEIAKGVNIPAHDRAPLRFNQFSLVGVAQLNGTEGLKDTNGPDSDLFVTVSDKLPYSTWIMPLTENRVGWGISGNLLNPQEHDEANFKFSNWGPEYIDETISQGAIQTILDAICLSNLLYELPSTKQEHIERAFEAYSRIRQPIAQAAVETSILMMRVVSGQTFMNSLSRKFLFNMPRFLYNKVLDKMYSGRPIARFLEPVALSGTTPDSTPEMTAYPKRTFGRSRSSRSSHHLSATMSFGETSTAISSSSTNSIRSNKKPKGYKGTSTIGSSTSSSLSDLGSIRSGIDTSSTTTTATATITSATSSSGNCGTMGKGKQSPLGLKATPVETLASRTDDGSDADKPHEPSFNKDLGMANNNIAVRGIGNPNFQNLGVNNMCH